METPIFDPGFGKSGKFYNKICMIDMVKYHVLRSFQGQKELVRVFMRKSYLYTGISK